MILPLVATRHTSRIVPQGRKTILIKRLEDFIDFKGGNRDLIVAVKTKRRSKEG